MNDNALHELMRHEADQAPHGDGDDLRRGRSRLRRHRLVAGGTGLAAVALAATVIGGAISMPGDGTAPATHGSSGPSAEQQADRTGRAITKAMTEHTRIEEFGQGRPSYGLLGGIVGADGRVSTVTDAFWRQGWSEAGGTGVLEVTVSRHRRDTPLPQRWYANCAERVGAWQTAPGVSWPDSYDSCNRTEVNGQPVMTGVERRSDRLWILVKYLRADGTVAELSFRSPYLASDQAVVHPSLTAHQLIDVATDPRVRLYPDARAGDGPVVEPAQPIEPTSDRSPHHE